MASSFVKEPGLHGHNWLWWWWWWWSLLWLGCHLKNEQMVERVKTLYKNLCSWARGVGVGCCCRLRRLPPSRFRNDRSEVAEVMAVGRWFQFKMSPEFSTISLIISPVCTLTLLTSKFIPGKSRRTHQVGTRTPRRLASKHFSGTGRHVDRGITRTARSCLSWNVRRNKSRNSPAGILRTKSNKNSK